MIQLGLRLQSFAFAGCCALSFPIIVGALQNLLSWLNVSPPGFSVGPLLWVATLSLWILLLLFGRLIVKAAARRALLELDRGNESKRLELGDALRAALSAYLPWPEAAGSPTEARRLNESAYDIESRIQAWYMPLQGLIWALPAVGFLCTAWELRRALLLGLVHGGEQGIEARKALVQQLHPILGLALLVICVALGAAAACHVLATVLAKAETELALALRAMLRKKSEP
jgi:hypothetical protein